VLLSFPRYRLSRFVGASSLAALLLAGCAFLLPARPASSAQDKQAPLGKHLYPLAAPASRVPVVTIDVSDAPEARAWAEQARTLVQDWFPAVWRLLATDKATPPEQIRLVFRKQINAPAYASGDAITVNADWIRQHPDDFGMMIHELTHVIQSYPGGGNKPGWLVEGIADFIRWWRYEPEGPRPRIDPLKASYRDSYRITAAFLAWATAKYDKRLVPQLDRALRTRTYRDEIFQEVTGKSLDALWAEFAPRPDPQPAGATSNTPKTK
jgi:hypothetical protein